MPVKFKAKDIPCYECICVPICRMKPFTTMLNECEKMSYFYYNETFSNTRQEEYDNKVKAMEDALKKPVWADRLKQIQDQLKEEYENY